MRDSAGISWSLFCLAEEGSNSRIVPLQQSRLHLRIVFSEPLRFLACRVNSNLLFIGSLLRQLHSEHLVIRLFCFSRVGSRKQGGNWSELYTYFYKLRPSRSILSKLQQVLMMWQKYKLSKHKKKHKHLPLLVFEEREFERKKYFRIRCRHLDRVLSEWMGSQAFSKLSHQPNYPPQHKQGKVKPVNDCVIDHRIKKDQIFYKIVQEDKIIIEVLAQELLKHGKESQLVYFLQKQLLSPK